MTTLIIILIVAVVLQNLTMIYFNWKGKKERERQAVTDENVSYYTKCIALEREGFQKQLDARDDIILDWKRKYDVVANEKNTIINWESVRYQIIVSAIGGMLANSRWDDISSNGFSNVSVIGNAISYADYAVDELKKIFESKKQRQR